MTIARDTCYLHRQPFATLISISYRLCRTNGNVGHTYSLQPRTNKQNIWAPKRYVVTRLHDVWDAHWRGGISFVSPEFTFAIFTSFAWRTRKSSRLIDPILITTEHLIFYFQSWGKRSQRFIPQNQTRKLWNVRYLPDAAPLIRKSRKKYFCHKYRHQT